MNVKMKNQLEMYDQVHTVLENFRSGWESTPTFADTVSRFEQKRDSIHGINETLLNKTKWMAKYKNILLADCQEEGFKFIGFLKVLALKNGIKKDVIKYSISKREFTSGFKNDKMGRLLNLVAEIQLQSAELISMGISQERIDSFFMKVTELDGIVSSPRASVVERADLNEQLTHLNKSTLNLLYDEIDKLIYMFESTLPDFVNRYFKSRNIVDRHGKLNIIQVDDSPERDDGQDEGITDPGKPFEE